MKIVTVVGARPQLIKAAPVTRALARAGIEEVLLHTGQHYDPELSRVFFEELGLPAPRHDLGVGSASHGVQTARMLTGIEEVLVRERPDWLLVYGDTNSTLAGALAAAKLGLPIAHVEAGLRCGDLTMPEEINRVLTDRISRLLLAPTGAAVRNLQDEGVDPGRIVRTGDVMYDACLLFAPFAPDAGEVAGMPGLAEGAFVLATVHRAANTDDPARLAAIARGFAEVARSVPLLFPVHPRTRRALAAAGELDALERSGVRLLPPQGYLEMMALERAAALVATDSGGVQKEAFFHGRPCVTLRRETEWVELVELGWNRLVDPVDPEAVAGGILGALRSPPPGPERPEVFGKGQAADAVVAALVSAGARGL